MLSQFVLTRKSTKALKAMDKKEVSVLFCNSHRFKLEHGTLRVLDTLLNHVAIVSHHHKVSHEPSKAMTKTAGNTLQILTLSYPRFSKEYPRQPVCVGYHPKP